MKPAVLLMAYGGPNSLDELEPYLLDVRGGRPVSLEFFAEIRQRYALIGGRSPLLDITRQQAAALESFLNRSAPIGETDVQRVYVGMRHWRPYIQQALQEIEADGFHEVTAICMAPHASRMSTGAYRKKLEAAQAALKAPLAVNFVDSWHDHPLLIQALAEKVQAAATRFSESERQALYYIFSAHSLPAVVQEQGDPYAGQLMETARLLAGQLGLAPEQWSFCFQSSGAADGKWLGPDICEVIPQLAAQGVKNLLVTPIGFVAEHVEVLFDLDIEARQAAEAVNIHFERSRSLNTAPLFIEALAQLVQGRVEV